MSLLGLIRHHTSLTIYPVNTVMCVAWIKRDKMGISLRLRRSLTSAPPRQLSSSAWKLTRRPTLWPASRILFDCATSNTPFSQNTSTFSTESAPLRLSPSTSGSWLRMTSSVASSALEPLKREKKVYPIAWAQFGSHFQDRTVEDANTMELISISTHGLLDI